MASKISQEVKKPISQEYAKEEVAATVVEKQKEATTSAYEADDLDIPVFLRRQRKH